VKRNRTGRDVRRGHGLGRRYDGNAVVRAAFRQAAAMRS
jgi:hypothetical protein